MFRRLNRSASTSLSELITLVCEEAKKYPVVMSLRRPHSVINSWRKRYNNTSGLYAQMMLSYYFIQTHEPLLLPVEEPDRAAYLHFMGKALDLDLRTDWEKVGTSIAQERPFNDVDIQMDEVLTSIYYQILERGYHGQNYSGPE